MASNFSPVTMLLHRPTLKASYFADREPAAVIPVALFDDDQKLEGAVTASRPTVMTTLGPWSGSIRVRLTYAELLALRSVPVRVETREDHYSDNCCLNWLCYFCSSTHARIVIKCDDGERIHVADGDEVDVALKWIAHLASSFNAALQQDDRRWVVTVVALRSELEMVEDLLSLFLRAMKHQLPSVLAATLIRSAAPESESESDSEAVPLVAAPTVVAAPAPTAVAGPPTYMESCAM